MKRTIRVFSPKGDEVLAAWEAGQLTVEAQAEFDQLMRQNFCIMDMHTETPARQFDPDHDYFAFRQMAGGSHQCHILTTTIKIS